MRLLALGLVILGLSFYAWKDWYTSLCGLIVLTSVLQHPDMPRTILDIPGLNPWNVLFLVVLLAWLFQRRREGLRWDLPRLPAVLLLLGLGLLLIGFVRLIVDREGLVQDATIASLVSDYLINPVKWVIVGLLLFDGCRSRRRLILGLLSILSLYLLLSLQVLRWVVPGGALDGSQLSSYTLRKLNSELGYHRNDLSVVLAGASWAILSMRSLFLSFIIRIAITFASLTVLFAQALTGGRGGYLAWGAVGLALGLVRWRRYLLLGPIIVVLAVSLVPSAAERALEGLHDEKTGWRAGSVGWFVSEEIDLEQLTAGRHLIWPPVIEKIWDAPFLGYGRAAMQRTGVTERLMAEEDEALIEHPHNAYLESLLDSGFLGLLVTLGLYGTFAALGLSLIRDRRNAECAGVGAVGLALVLAQLVGGFTGQSFWPREATFGMWCAIGILLRVWVERDGGSSSPPTPASREGVPTRDIEWWRRDSTATHLEVSMALGFRPQAVWGSRWSLPERSS